MYAKMFILFIYTSIYVSQFVRDPVETVGPCRRGLKPPLLGVFGSHLDSPPLPPGVPPDERVALAETRLLLQGRRPDLPHAEED